MSNWTFLRIEAMSIGKRQTRQFVDEYTLPDKRKIYVLGEGRLINLVAAEGHPAVVMDMSFTIRRFAWNT